MRKQVIFFPHSTEQAATASARTFQHYRAVSILSTHYFSDSHLAFHVLSSQRGCMFLDGTTNVLCVFFLPLAPIKILSM